MLHLFRTVLALLAVLALAAVEHPLGTPAAGGDQLWERGDVILFAHDVAEQAGTAHFMYRLRDGINVVRPELEIQLQSVWTGDSRQLVNVVTDQVIPRQPALVVLFAGHRSASGPADQAPDAAKFEAALREAIEKIAAAGFELVVVGPSVVSDTPEAKTPADELVATYNRVAGEVARAANATYVDLRAPCLEWLKAHPPEAGKPALYAGEGRYTTAWMDLAAPPVAKAIGERMSAVGMKIDIQDAPFIDRAMVEIPVRRLRRGTTASIYYTIDGKDPTKASKKYEKPFAITTPNTVLKVLAVDNSTGATATARAVFTKVKGKPGESPSRRALGLEWGLYQGTWSFLPEYGSLKPSITGVWHAPELAAFREVDAYATMAEKIGLRFVGYIDIPVEGVYTFETTSDDGSRMWIDDELAVENDGGHGMRFRIGRVALKEGLHKVRIDYFQGGGSMGLEVWWSSDAGIRRSRVPDNAWFYNPGKPHVWDAPPPKKDEPKKDEPKKDEPKKK